MLSNDLSNDIIGRGTLYYLILADFFDKKVEYISVDEISDLLNIKNAQIKKDFKMLVPQFKNSDMFVVSDLKNALEQKFYTNKLKKAFIIGAGHIGMALAKYDNFKNFGLNILALFDIKKEKISSSVNGKLILDIRKFPNLVSKSGVDLVILTVPKNYAQIMANYIVAAGVKYIWNFTSVVLDVPKDVHVWNENLIADFLKFSNEI